MPTLSRDQIIDISDLQTERLHVPEWNGDVLVRPMTGWQRSQLEMAFIEQDAKQKAKRMANLRERVVAWCTVGENGERLFSDSDAAVLASKNAAAIGRIFDCAWKLSGLTKEEADALGEGSEPAPGGASSSA